MRIPFKCKLQPNNINTRDFFMALKPKNLLKQVCLQRWFCNSLCVCECVGVHAVHLSIYMSECLFPQCSRVKYKGEIWHFQESLLQAAALDLLPRTALFWKNHCIVIFYDSYDPLEVPQLPLLWHFASFALPLFLPPVRSLATLVHRPLLPQSTASLLTSLCPFSPLTLHTNRRPTAYRRLPPLPRDPLTSSCFSCWRRQLSKCLREELLSFSLNSWSISKTNFVACVKIWRMTGQIRKVWHGYCVLILGPRKGSQREIKDSISL